MPLRPMLLAVLLGLAASRDAAARDLPEIKRQGVLRAVCVHETWSPSFVSLTPGTEPGFDREIVEAFARGQGLRVEYVTLQSWDELVPALLKGDGDLIIGRFSNTPARRESLDFTRETFPTRLVVANLKPAPPILTLADLRARKLGTYKGSSMLEALVSLGLPPAGVTMLPVGSVMQALRSGQVEGAVWVVEAAMLEAAKDPALQLGMFLGPHESLGYALPKGQAPALLAALDGHIQALRATGTWNRLVVKYFGESALPILKRATEE